MDARSRAPQRYVVPLSEIPWVSDGSLPRMVEPPEPTPSAVPVAPRPVMPAPRVAAPEPTLRSSIERSHDIELPPPRPAAAPQQGLFDLPGLLGRIWMVSELQHARESAPAPESPRGRAEEPMSTPARATTALAPANPGDITSIHRTTRWISLTIVENQTDSPVPTRMRSPLPVPHAESTTPEPARSGASLTGGRAWTCPGCRVTNAPWSVVCPVCHRAPSAAPTDDWTRTRPLVDPSASW
jgi:hypothetical protein